VKVGRKSASEIRGTARELPAGPPPELRFRRRLSLFGAIRELWKGRELVRTLTEREFLVAVAMGMMSPGPVVITATFVGYLVAGFWGSLVATIGIFLPSFLLVLVVAPVLMRYRTNPNVQGFIKGAYAAAIGTILGACVLLGGIAIGDWLTALVALVSLVVLFRFKVSNPLLIAGAAVIGLIAFPLLQPGWVFVK
jgi:chromate transporter